MNPEASPSDPSPSEDEGHTTYTGRKPKEIETEIDRTREGLDRTLDELESRLSPRERLHAAADSAREMGRRAVNSAVESMTPSITSMIRLDHMHVLALFRRFRPWTSVSRKRALVANACIALEIHARLEEEIFYPAVREAGGDTEVLDKSVPEHNEMRRLIAELRASDPLGDPRFDDKFQTLMRVVLHHVADEESVVLPLAEASLTDQLGVLGARMTRRRMQLLAPSLAEVAVTTGRSFPLLTAALGLGIAATAWMLLRPGSRRGLDS
jgi:hemerythrin superfamily protein